MVGEPQTLYTRLARSALEQFVRSGQVMPVPDPVPDDLAKPAACFVSLKTGGELRGCIGTIEPAEPCLAAEIIANAISAGTRDPRFFPVCQDEFPSLVYSVDVLSTPEPIESIEGHDPREFGLIVQAGGRRGLLLPDLEGVDTAAEQMRICRAKGGIGPDELVRLMRFRVERYH